MHPLKKGTSPLSKFPIPFASHEKTLDNKSSERKQSNRMSTATTVARRPKWQPIQPPPPSPKILNLPRRNRHRKQLKKTTRKPSPSIPNDTLLDLNQNYYYYYHETKKGKLERLFGEEREFSRSDCTNVPIVLLNSSAPASSSSFSSSLSSGRRDRVEEEEFVEGKWKFQAEILRAECNFLRLEREVALKKLERNKVQMERILKSAVQTLISGRKKIFEGKNVTAILGEEIEDVVSKLVELQRSSGFKDNLEVKKCSNFDKKTCLLQLAKIGGLSDEDYVKELQDLADSSLSMNMSLEIDNGSCGSGPRSKHESIEAEMLRRKMEGLSKEMLQRIEEDFGSILSTIANSSVASSASTSKRIEYQETAFPSHQPYQESLSHEDIRCTGRCKAIVRRIVEQVRAETEQWSQMQGMLRQVREEMEELQDSRKFWEDRALNSDLEVQHLQSAVQDWKVKALASENKANELEKDRSMLKGELEKLTPQCIELGQVTINTQMVPPKKEKCIVSCDLKENHHTGEIECNQETTAEKLKGEKNHQIMQSADLPPISLGKQLEKEKRMLRRLKERCRAYDKRSKEEISTDGRRKSHAFNSGLASLKHTPFRDIGNLSPLIKHNNKTVSSPLIKHNNKTVSSPLIKHRGKIAVLLHKSSPEK